MRVFFWLYPSHVLTDRSNINRMTLPSSRQPPSPCRARTGCDSGTLHGAHQRTSFPLPLRVHFSHRNTELATTLLVLPVCRSLLHSPSTCTLQKGCFPFHHGHSLLGPLWIWDWMLSYWRGQSHSSLLTLGRKTWG